MSSSHTPVKATKRLFYPFLHTDGKQVKHVSAYYKALAQAGEGYYPMGRNGQWHGGIHFNKATASAGDLKQATGVRCLADGEVVAWRIDKTYPQVAYPALTENGVTVHDACKATYSTGFVLVRHRLALPQPPQSGDSQAQGASSSTVASGPAASPPSVEFYSLYMHLMSWDNYQRHPADEFRPHLWPANGPMYRADKASDHYTKGHNPYAPTDDSKGVNLRKKGEHATYMGFAPKNAVLKLGDKETSQYYEVLAIDGENVGLKEGLDASALQNVVAWKGELTAMPSQPSQFGHVVVPDTPIAIKAGDIVGHLGIYEHFADVKHTPAAHATPPTVFAPDSDHEMMHLEVFTTDPNFIKTCRQQARYALDSEKSLLFIKKGAQLALPTQADTSIAASTLVQAVGGDDKSPWVKVVYATGSQETIIAHADLGAYHDGSYALEAKTRKALHTAIPTVAEGDFLGRVKFISKSNKTNRLVKAHYGKQAWIKRSDLPDPHDATATDAAIEAWSKFPLQTDATNGPKATLEKVMPIHDLTDRATALTHTDDGNHDNDKTARWWHVEVATTDDQAKGWACEAGQSDVSLCSPWDWPGFEEETAAATPEQLYAAATLAHGNYAADEKAKLEALAQQASTGPLFKQMCQIIDSKGQGSGKSNGTLSSDEITTAMHDPMIVRHMAHLIVKHKSEWAEPDAIKSVIKPLIPQRSHKDWDAEAKRIAKLAWWEDATSKGILPTSPQILSFNPVSLISSIRSLIHCTSAWKLNQTFLEASEGKLVLNGYVPKYSSNVLDEHGNIVHHAGDVIGQSGVTISTGVDLGQQSKGGTRDIITTYIDTLSDSSTVDVNSLMSTLSPYFGKKKTSAVSELSSTPLSITLSQAKILANSFSYHIQTQVAAKFNKTNSLKIKFKCLPEEAQTVIIDFAYQYGLSQTSGSTRKSFWDRVNGAKWEALANWLLGSPDQYTNRRSREGKYLQYGIKSGSLPTSGNPCL